MENFIVIATYTYPYEYTILKLLLEKEGIPHVFENETMVSVSPFYSNAIGGIKLRIHKRDYKTVKSIIEQLDASSDLHIV